jgi:hypothetical protein
MSSVPISRPIYDADRSRPVKDPKYLAWIRTLPCVVPGCRGRAEAAHCGARGLSQKASDTNAIPMCAHHHREYHQFGRRKFETRYCIHIERLIQRLNQKPFIRVLGLRYVMQLSGEEHDLGSIRKPVAAAMKQAILLARSRLPF